MATDPLALPGASLRLWPDFLAPAEADATLRTLRDEIPWEQHELVLFGRRLGAPRLSCWIGDPEARYRYSGSSFVPRPWTPTLLALRARIGAAVGARFNSVLANLYRDGRDGMGWHADDEPELGTRPQIASLSLGAPRRFLLRQRDGDARGEILLPHGSLLLMHGDTQRNYRHSLPKTRRSCAERLNLTFRHVTAPR